MYFKLFFFDEWLRLGRGGGNWGGPGGAVILLLHVYRDTAEDPEEMHRLISHGT